MPDCGLTSGPPLQSCLNTVGRPECVSACHSTSSVPHRVWLWSQVPSATLSPSPPSCAADRSSACAALGRIFGRTPFRIRRVAPLNEHMHT
eukprot:351077-Chlamydomonas_euryale.AAC.1